MFVLGRVPCGGTALGFPTPWEPFCNVRLFFLSGVLPFALSRKRFSRPCPEGLFGCVSRFRPRIALLECVSRRGSGRLSGCVSRRGSGSPAGCVFRRGSGRLSGCVSRRGSGSPAGCVFRRGSGCPAGLLRSRDRRFPRLSRGTSERLRQPLSGPFRTAAYIFVVANYLTKLENLSGKSKYYY